MKIPSSSSLFFATLAISSSSSSLAAPAGDSGHSEGVSDVQHSVARRASTSVPAMIVDDIRSALDSRQVPAVIGIIEDLPIVGGILRPILGAASVPPARRDQLNAINDASQVPTQVPASMGNLTGLPVTLPVSVVPAGLPTGALPNVSQGPLRRVEADEVADSSSADASYTSTATDAPSSATQGSMAAAAIPSLPTSVPILGSLPVPVPSNTLVNHIPVSSLPVIGSPPLLPVGVSAADVDPMESGTSASSSAMATETPGSTTAI